MAAAVLLAFVSTLALMPLAIVVLRRFGIVDRPSARSSHDRPVIRGGGLAPAIGCLFAGVISLSMSHPYAVGVLVASAAFGIVGAVEDLAGIPAFKRLAGQFGAAAIASLWLLAGLSGPALWQLIFGAGVVVWLVAYTNAFNFMDGINGISTAQLAIAGGAWAFLGVVESFETLAVSGAVVAAAAVGFLPFNFPQARVFLGDVGSYFLGAWLAATLVIALRAGLPPEAVIAPLTIYLADTGTTIVKRVRAGEPIHEPHRRHAYQRLVQLGWSHARTTLIVGAFMAACSIFGLLALGTPEARIAGDAALAITLLVYLVLPRVVERSEIRVRATG